MMKFAIVESKNKRWRIGSFESLRAAEQTIGLDPMTTDHGVICKPGEDGLGFGIVVCELSLYVPPARQSYFAIGGKLYGGDAVLYAFDRSGASADLENFPLPIRFFDDRAAVEGAIAANDIARPELSINGHLIWRWPEPPPEDDVTMETGLREQNRLLQEMVVTLATVVKELMDALPPEFATLDNVRRAMDISRKIMEQLERGGPQ